MRRLKNTVSAIACSLFVAGSATLGLLILTAEFPLPGEWIDTARCAAGVPAPGSPCVADAIRAADDARKAAEAALAGQNLEFTQGEKLKAGVSLVVGTMYRDAASQTGIIRSFCWAVVDNGRICASSTPRT